MAQDRPNEMPDRSSRPAGNPQRSRSGRHKQLAEALGKNINGLTYGTAEPVLRKAKTKANREIIQKREWKVGSVLRLDDALWIITDISNPAKIVLRGLDRPKVEMTGRGVNRRPFGLRLPFKAKRTEAAFDISNADTVDPRTLVIY